MKIQTTNIEQYHFKIEKSLVSAASQASFDQSCPDNSSVKSKGADISSPIAKAGTEDLNATLSKTITAIQELAKDESSLNKIYNLKLNRVLKLIS